jgi:hypothetical protein
MFLFNQIFGGPGFLMSLEAPLADTAAQGTPAFRPASGNQWFRAGKLKVRILA